MSAKHYLKSAAAGVGRLSSKQNLLVGGVLAAVLTLASCTAMGTPPTGSQSPPHAAAPSGSPSADPSTDPRVGTYPYPNCPEDVNGCEWDPNGFPYDGLMWEMDEALQETLLPEGTVIVRPVDNGPYPVGDTLAVDMWEAGYGWILVEEGAFCLWMGTWLTSRGVDAVQEESALRQMQHFLETRTFQNAYDPQSAQVGIRDLLQRAELGDPSAAQRTWVLMCPHYHDQIKVG